MSSFKQSPHFVFNWRLFVLVLLFMTGSHALAQADPILESPLVSQASAVAAMVKAQSDALDARFTPEFLNQVPVAALGSIFSEFFKRVGACRNATATRVLEAGAVAGTFSMECERGFRVDFDLRIESQPPHRIAGLLLKAPVALGARSVSGLDAAVKTMATLGPAAGFVLADLSGGVVRSVHSINADVPFQIGSVAKLCVLSSLLASIESEKMAWDQVTRLQESDRSLASGRLGTWPAGAPLTLHTLATLLLVDSDNTANDMLWRLLEALPARAQALEESAMPGCNVPFMTTQQYFVLRASPDLARTYRATPVSQRLEFLQAMPLMNREDLLKKFTSASAVDVAPVGWESSPQQFIQTLATLARQMQRPRAQPVRDIFTLSRPAGLVPERFSFAAVKGGSDRGMLSYGALLEPRPGQTYALAAFWNGPQPEPPDEFNTAVRALIAALPLHSGP